MKEVMSDRLKELLKDPTAAKVLREKLRAGADQQPFKIQYESKDQSKKEVTLKLSGGF